MTVRAFFRVPEAGKNLYIRRALGVLVLFLAALLQNTRGLSPSFFGARVLWLIPLTVCMAMFEHDFSTACGLGIFAGVLWDVSLSGGDGFHALFLMLAATVTGLLINYLMRNNLYTAMLLCGCVLLLYVLLHWLVFVAARGVQGAGSVLLSFYLPSALLTFAFLPLIYFLMRRALKRLKEKYPDNTRVRRP